MSSTDEKLERWTAAGLIDPTTAESIRAFERDEPDGKPPGNAPGVVEVLLYLGVLVVGAGIVALVGQRWSELESPARVATMAVPGVLALVAGLGLRTLDEPSLRRAGELLWLAALAAAAGTIAVVMYEYGAESNGSGDDRPAVLVTAGVTFAVAVALWAASGSGLQLFGLAGAVVFLGQALGNWPDDFSAAWAGVLLVGFGVVAMALGDLRLLAPRGAALPLFALVAAMGAYEAGIDGKLSWAEALAFVVAAGLIGFALARGRFDVLLIGAVLAFVSLVTVMFEYFEDEIGAPVALMLSGGVLVAVVLLLIPVRSGLASQEEAS